MYKPNYKTPILLILTLFTMASLLLAIVEKELSFLTGMLLMIYVIINTLYVTWDDCFKL